MVSNKIFISVSPDVIYQIISLKEYSIQYSVSTEIHIVAGNEKLCKIY